MDALSATNPVGPEMYALKQATKVQEDVVMKLLDTLPSPVETTAPSVSGLADQGIGVNLDIRG